MSSTTPPKARKHLCYEPNSGTVNCYHCGDFYQVTPCTPAMAVAVIKQFDKEHRRCKQQPRGEERLAKIIADNKGKPAGGFGKLALRPGATLGEKIAHGMEMEILSNALNGGEIPEGLRNDPKFMKAVEDMRAAGITLEKVEKN